MNCNLCAKQMTCTQKTCSGLVKFSQTKNYGEVKVIKNNGGG